MAHANLAGFVNVFGLDAKKLIKSCEFHFKDLRNKRAKRLDTDSAKEFKALCNELLRSTTLAANEAAVRGQMGGGSNTLSGYTNYTGISLSDNLLF